MKTNMIEISQNIQLKKIRNSDADFLLKLMKEIYPSAYSHFWEDKGAWYVNSQYSKEVVLREIQEPKTDYFFVLFKDCIVGVFRVVWDEALKGFLEQPQVKLHRIYLSNETQGIGLGKKLLSWLEGEAIKKGYQMIWLDAMDQHTQALQFYKKLGYTYHSYVILPFDLLYEKVRKMNQLYKVLKVI